MCVGRVCVGGMCVGGMCVGGVWAMVRGQCTKHTARGVCSRYTRDTYNHSDTLGLLQVILLLMMLIVSSPQTRMSPMASRSQLGLATEEGKT